MKGSCPQSPDNFSQVKGGRSLENSSGLTAHEIGKFVKAGWIFVSSGQTSSQIFCAQSPGGSPCFNSIHSMFP